MSSGMEAPYFPFYPGDWLSDGNVQAMTLEESGAYITLLAHMWKDGDDCSLPDDDRFLAKILHVTANRWKKLREALIDGNGSVFYVREGRIRNPRMDKEFRAMIEKSEKSRDAANTRWSKSKGDASAMQTQCERMPGASDPHMRNDAISDSESDPDLEKKKTEEEPPIPPVTGLEELGPKVQAEMQVRMGKANYAISPEDFQMLRTMMSDGVPAEYIMRGIASAFERFRPKYSTDKIRSFSYCKDIIYEMWETDQAKRQVAVSAEVRVQRGQARSRGRPLTAMGSGGSVPGQKDERYAKFYELFPDA